MFDFNPGGLLGAPDWRERVSDDLVSVTLDPLARGPFDMMKLPRKGHSPGCQLTSRWNSSLNRHRSKEKTRRRGALTFNYTRIVDFICLHESVE